jgi:hypothetical protein
LKKECANKNNTLILVAFTHPTHRLGEIAHQPAAWLCQEIRERQNILYIRKRINSILNSNNYTYDKRRTTRILQKMFE